MELYDYVDCPHCKAMAGKDCINSEDNGICSDRLYKFADEAPLEVRIQEHLKILERIREDRPIMFEQNADDFKYNSWVLTIEECKAIKYSF
jgi:hypothetical protein